MNTRPTLVAPRRARWAALRAAMERLNAAARPRFVSLLLLLGSSVAGLTIVWAWLAH